MSYQPQLAIQQEMQEQIKALNQELQSYTSIKTQQDAELRFLRNQCAKLEHILNGANEAKATLKAKVLELEDKKRAVGVDHVTLKAQRQADNTVSEEGGEGLLDMALNQYADQFRNLALTPSKVSEPDYKRGVSGLCNEVPLHDFTAQVKTPIEDSWVGVRVEGHSLITQSREDLRLKSNQQAEQQTMQQKDLGYYVNLNEEKNTRITFLESRIAELEALAKGSKLDQEAEIIKGLSHSVDFLNYAAEIQSNRAATYDTPEGERSMGKAVGMLNTLRNLSLKTSDGWALLVFLKMVRGEQRASFHADSAVDSVSYLALYSEELKREGVQTLSGTIGTL